MSRIGIALDLGTSGFRGQAVDLEQDGVVLSTAVTTRHPLPGANVMDHLHCAVEVGLRWAHDVVVEAVNQIIAGLDVPKESVIRLAVCGNPIQLSLFQEIEIRDLAYAGKRKLQALGVTSPNRDGGVFDSSAIRGLDLPNSAEILIPPAVRHEVGADALAMMIHTGMLEKDEIAIATDYGTNAEMALVVNGRVFSGSTAAGPALEGQQIEDGLLALPGAISDVAFEPCERSNPPVGNNQEGQSVNGWLSTTVLNKEMLPCPGDTIDPETGENYTQGEKAVGITGTGVIALMSQGLEYGLIRIPKITTRSGEITLPNNLRFRAKDVLEAGKAFGALRAGHMALCHEAGIDLDKIETAYMSGASGTYVDALKAKDIGLIPAGATRISQVGNTSLAMARDLLQSLDELHKMQQISDHLKQNHCMFAESKVFEKVYILELSYWTEGMSSDQYQHFLKKFGLPPFKEAGRQPEVVKKVDRDIVDTGLRGLRIIQDIGLRKKIHFPGCIGCGLCAQECPEIALRLDEENEMFKIDIELALCNGVACKRCEKVCEEKVFDWIGLITC